MVGEQSPFAKLDAEGLRRPVVEVEAERRRALPCAIGVRDAVLPQTRNLAQPLEGVTGERRLVSFDSGVGEVKSAGPLAGLGPERLEVLDRGHEPSHRLVTEGAGLEAMAERQLVGGAHSVGRKRACEVAAHGGDAEMRTEVLVGGGEQDVCADAGTVQAPVRRQVHAVDPDQGTCGMGCGGHALHIGDRAKRI